MACNNFDFTGTCPAGEECTISCKADGVGAGCGIANTGPCAGVCQDATFIVNGNGDGCLKKIECDADQNACNSASFDITNPCEGFEIICKGIMNNILQKH